MMMRVFSLGDLEREVAVGRMRIGGEATIGEQGKVYYDADSPVLLLRLQGGLRTTEERVGAAPGKLRDGYKVGDAVEVCYTPRDEGEDNVCLK